MCLRDSVLGAKYVRTQVFLTPIPPIQGHLLEDQKDFLIKFLSCREEKDA